MIVTRKTKDTLMCLSDRLNEHSAIHAEEYIKYGDQEQMQWADDLNIAAELIKKLAEILFILDKH